MSNTTTHTTQTAAEQLLTTATEQLDTHCSSAIFALDEGLRSAREGDYVAGARWALRSMSHSIGVFAPAYKQSAALWLRATDESPAAEAIRLLSLLADGTDDEGDRGYSLGMIQSIQEMPERATDRYVAQLRAAVKEMQA